MAERRGTVLWKVAGVLVGVQVATALLAIALVGWLAREQALDLVEGNLRLRLDAVAEEVEARADFDEETGALTLPRRLRLDLPTRFPDPVLLLDADCVAESIGDSSATNVEAVPFRERVPDGACRALDDGRIAIDRGEGWALAPLLAPDGLPAGGLLIQPLDATLREEFRGTRRAFVQGTLLAVGAATVLALLLGAFFTGRLVRPLRRMTRRVEALGEGDYADRLTTSDDELGRLSAAINEMAARVEASIEALRATDRHRRELVANVGHDLRTPLAALTGYLDEAARLTAEGRDAEAAEALATAQRQSAHLARLVADLFELSTLEGAAHDSAGPLQRGPVPLAELLHDAARIHQPMLEEAGLSFEFDVPSSLPILEADGARLLRVLDNLLANARRHTPPGGTVRLMAALDEDAVRIQVSDTGEGIAPDDLGSVFDRYYRGTSARTREGGEAGGGLGLAISLAIARAHRGDLTAESVPGQGSAFTLTLPSTTTAA